MILLQSMKVILSGYIHLIELQMILQVVKMHRLRMLVLIVLKWQVVD